MLDITERKRADQALRAGEEKFRSLYLRTPVMLHSIDESGRLISVSGHWLDRMGYELDEVLGRPLTEFLTEESAVRERTTALPRLSATGRLEQFARQYRRRDETIIETLVDEVVERDAAGNFLRSLSVSTDVTERLRMEADLRQAQKMDAVGQLTGGIAHDFNNMLTVIAGNLELLSMKLKARPELQRLAETAMGTTNRAARLTQQLLAFSRKQQLRPEPIHFAQILAGMEELLRRTVGERITLAQDMPDDLWWVTADPNQLETALLNLVLNSRDAMPDGGTVTVRGRNAEVTPGEAARYADAVAGNYGVLSVIDTGIGMSPAVLAMAIEPFFTTKDVGRGTGLGLSMVYGFVRQSLGHVRIESRAGAGTSVSLYLPSASPPDTVPR
jgi:PAS domain S-box-containing protein